MSGSNFDTVTLQDVRERLLAPPPKPEPKSSLSRLEITAVVAAIFGMIGLFMFVSPSNASANTRAHSSNIVSYDFRDETIAPATLERRGTIIENLSGTGVLQVLGADPAQADDVMAAFVAAGHTSEAGPSTGTVLTAHFETNDADDAILGDLIAVSFRPNPEHTMIATRLSDGTYFASQLTAKLTKTRRHISGAVDTNLKDAILAEGGTTAHFNALTQAFSSNRKIAKGGTKGDQFEIVFESYLDERGRFIKAGKLEFVAYKGSGATGEWYHFAPADTGRAEFFAESGQAAAPFLTRYPVSISRVTSGFGQRTHPIGGYTHLHTGVDFAAPMGAHVYAAGDGVVEEVSTRSGYGLYVRIRHPRGYKTSYAHMSRFERSLTAGQQVKRGDLIGYVGSTGAVTGPHLHYEVRKNGRFVNPMNIELPSGRNLARKPDQMEAFRAYREAIEAERQIGKGALYMAKMNTYASYGNTQDGRIQLANP
jgi:murein DD-endopeptidase MepM/ murein hydrolase activator NlpD